MFFRLCVLSLILPAINLLFILNEPYDVMSVSGNSVMVHSASALVASLLDHLSAVTLGHLKAESTHIIGLMVCTS